MCKRNKSYHRQWWLWWGMVTVSRQRRWMAVNVSSSLSSNHGKSVTRSALRQVREGTLFIPFCFTLLDLLKRRHAITRRYEPLRSCRSHTAQTIQKSLQPFFLKLNPTLFDGAVVFAANKRRYVAFRFKLLKSLSTRVHQASCRKIIFIILKWTHRVI